MKRHVVISGTWKLFPVTSRIHSPSAQGPPSLSRAIPHVFPTVQAPRRTQAPPSIALVLLWLFGSFFTCTEIFIPSLPFTALSRAGVNFYLSPQPTTPHALSNSLFQSFSQLFFNAPTPGQQLLLDFALALGISLSIQAPYRCTSSVRSFNLDSSLYLITNLVPYLQFCFELLVHAPCLHRDSILRLQSPRHKLSQIGNIPRDSFRNIIGILPIVCTFPISAAPGCW